MADLPSYYNLKQSLPASVTELLANLGPSFVGNTKRFVDGIDTLLQKPSSVKDAFGILGYPDYKLASSLAGHPVDESDVMKIYPSRPNEKPNDADVRARNSILGYTRLRDALTDPYVSINPKTKEREWDGDKIGEMFRTDPFRVMGDLAVFTPVAEGALAGLSTPVKLAKRASIANDVNEAYKLHLQANPHEYGQNWTTFDDSSVAPSNKTKTFDSIETALQKAKDAIGSTGEWMTPGYNLLKVPNALGISGEGATGLLGKTTGSGEPVIKQAFKAGKESFSSDPELQKRAEIFRNFQTGNNADKITQASEIHSDLIDGIKKIRENASQNYLAGKANLINQPVDFSGAHEALDKIENELNQGPQNFATNHLQTIQDIRSAINDLQNKNANIIGADVLKQHLWERQGASSGFSQKAYGDTRKAVIDAMNEVDPNYNTVMQGYGDAQDLAKTIRSETGANSNSAIKATNKALKSLKGQTGQSLMNELEQVNPDLPYKIAGYSLSSLPGGTLASIAEGAGAASMILNPALLPFLPKAAAVAATTSPRIVGGATYRLGQLQGIGERGSEILGNAASPIGKVAENLGNTFNQALSDSPPVVQNAVKALKAAAPSPRTIASTVPITGEEEKNAPVSWEEIQSGELSNQTQQTSPKEESQDKIYSWEDMGIPDQAQQSAPRANGGRIERKSGGRVDNVQPLVDELMRKFKQAKKVTDKTTEPLLDQPDDAIVKALKVAQDAIQE